MLKRLTRSMSIVLYNVSASIEHQSAKSAIRDDSTVFRPHPYAFHQTLTSWGLSILFKSGIRWNISQWKSVCCNKWYTVKQLYHTILDCYWDFFWALIRILLQLKAHAFLFMHSLIIVIFAHMSLHLFFCVVTIVTGYNTFFCFDYSLLLLVVLCCLT